MHQCNNGAPRYLVPAYGLQPAWLRPSLPLGVTPSVKFPGAQKPQNALSLTGRSISPIFSRGFPAFAPVGRRLFLAPRTCLLVGEYPGRCMFLQRGRKPLLANSRTLHTAESGCPMAPSMIHGTASPLHTHHQPWIAAGAIRWARHPLPTYPTSKGGSTKA
jgi:hypothetical protein